MEWKKVKWLIIALLLAVNVFLGINIAIKYSSALKYEKQDLQRAVGLADDSLGFKLSHFKNLPRYLYSFYGDRDITAEGIFAVTLLGDKGKLETSGGGVYTYVLPTKERFIFRRGGNLEGIVPLGTEEPGSVIKEAMKKQSFDSVETDNGFTLKYNGTNIYNGGLEYTISGTYVLISGNLPICYKWEKAEKSRSRGEIVLALAQAISDNKVGKLESVSAVYYLQSDGAKGLRLTPAWVAQCSGGKIIISMWDKSVLSVEK